MKHFLLAAIILTTLLSTAVRPAGAQSQSSPAQQSPQGQPPAPAAQPPAKSPQQSQPQAGNQPQPQAGNQPPEAPPKSCLAVKPIGSHAFRNVMLFGVAGALISKQQYQVVDALNYPARVGQKYHGSDLQTISTGGVKVVILDKHYTTEDLHRACKN